MQPNDSDLSSPNSMERLQRGLREFVSGFCRPFILIVFMADGRAVAEGERKTFLSHGPGAAAAAMGEAVTADPEDVTAIYYNPAGLVNQPGAVHAEYTPVFDGGRYNFLGVHYPSRMGSFGFGIIQFAVDGIEGRQFIGDPPSSLSATQTAWYLPYAYGWKSLSLGAALKVVDMNLAGNKGAGVGMDGGAIYHTDLNDWGPFERPTLSFGTSVKNLLEPSYTLVTRGGSPSVVRSEDGTQNRPSKWSTTG